MKFGDWIIFQHITYKENVATISRPILGIFVDYTIWDQALVVNFIESPRAWTAFNKVVTNKELNISMLIAVVDPEVESIPLWNENIKVLGFWKTKPTYQQLKKSIKKSIT